MSGIGRGEERKDVKEIRRVVGFDEMIGIDRPRVEVCAGI